MSQMVLDDSVLLSIIVISHNQREQLKRCVDSILSQSIPFEYEVLVSDDASSDGSYELAQEYAEQYPMIHAFSCNTNDFNPSNRSFRSGINRCNALKHAKGKYLAHIDGDDFLLGQSYIYQKQVELLEQYPDCSCCMANDYTLIEGEELSNIVIRHSVEFDTGNILRKEDYIRDYFRESHCFVYRRQHEINPIEALGGYYEDNFITAFYLQFGDIVCIREAGYVYVQHSHSIMYECLKNNDYKIICCPALFNTGLMPQWKPVYWDSCRHLGMIKSVVSSAIKGEKLTDGMLKWISGFDFYLVHAFNRRLTFGDKLHLRVLFVLLGIMRRTKRKHPLWTVPWRILDKVI